MQMGIYINNLRPSSQFFKSPQIVVLFRPQALHRIRQRGLHAFKAYCYQGNKHRYGGGGYKHPPA